MKNITTFFLLAGACSSLTAQTMPSLDSLYLKSKVYSQQTALWSVYKTSQADIVMLGNSLTQGANWDELLGRPGIVNRGIGGDNLVGFFHRLQFVIALRPKVCFVMGGINDIYAGFTVDQIISNYMRVLETLAYAGITPVVQSTLHVSPRWRDAEAKNQLVSDLNGRLEVLCQDRGIPYLNLTPHLCPDKILKDEYTTDGIHLTAGAYSVWAGVIDSLLRERGL